MRAVFAVVMGLMVSAPAFAGKAELSRVQEALVTISQTEAESMAMMMEAIDASAPLPISDEAKAGWADAKKVHKQAAKAWKKKDYLTAYDLFTQAGDLAEPAFGELLVMDDPPQAVVDAGAAQIESLSKMVAGLARAVEQHGSDEAKAKYATAKASFDEAEKLWADPATRRDGAKKCWEATKTLNEAIRVAWAQKAAAE
ncbi:MAG: hypothetical protein H6738_16675 [Alphaproteobacteria bacterium]|nr:hypothetical protein [Alphaproteobacteria bacterium]MCB9698417.1 hypothetical protein [Alphaproteobacteria bacterium]